MVEVGGSEIASGDADVRVQVGVARGPDLFRIVHCDACEDARDAADHRARDGARRSGDGAHRGSGESPGKPCFGLVRGAVISPGR
jgi:hypothetical protein